MEYVFTVFSALYQFGDAFAFLVLSAAGLAVIFGMMGIINLAHGEFIMCGAYVTVSTARMGLPLPIAMLCGSLAAGLLGIVLERTIIHRLYHRPLDSIVATWGISLILVQGTLVVFGSSMPGISTPFSAFAVGDSTYSTYRMVLFGVAILVLAGLYLVFHHTKFGIHSRATIQAPSMAKAIGIDTGRMYTLTFGLGAALAGLAGALYAPTMSIVPTFGASFLVESFVTVVVGGADVFRNQPAAAILAVIKAALTGWQGQLIGQVGLLITVMVVIRILPQGLSGWLLKGRS